MCLLGNHENFELLKLFVSLQLKIIIKFYFYNNKINFYYPKYLFNLIMKMIVYISLIMKTNIYLL